MTSLSTENKNWVTDVCKKIVEKESKVMKKNGTKIPYTTINGTFDDKYETQPSWWTNGFWEGMVWLMYLETKDDFYKELENKLEDRMDSALYNLDGLHHDVGFMWLLSSVANYRINGNEKSKTRALIAANYLASRYNIEAGFISAWNGKEKEGWAIIDCLMNLPLLYWASEETGYSRFEKIARAHANKTLEYVVRDDGSVVHIIEYDLNNGLPKETFAGQGYAVGSSWTRGQSWAIYGYTLSYIHTKDINYLNAAKKIAHYFISAVADHDYIPPIDFRSPAEPKYVDTTAGAITACGLIEISKNVEEHEKSMYLNAAIKILKALESKYIDYSDNSDALLHYGSEAYHSTGIHMDIIYGDYFFMEAMFKLKGLEINLW